ncbi:hypothetical protein ACA910_002870 [Epithemia clementina (nom. ined.)]
MEDEALMSDSDEMMCSYHSCCASENNCGESEQQQHTTKELKKKKKKKKDKEKKEQKKEQKDKKKEKKDKKTEKKDKKAVESEKTKKNPSNDEADIGVCPLGSIDQELQWQRKSQHQGKKKSSDLQDLKSSSSSSHKKDSLSRIMRQNSSHHHGKTLKLSSHHKRSSLKELSSMRGENNKKKKSSSRSSNRAISSAIKKQLFNMRSILPPSMDELSVASEDDLIDFCVSNNGKSSGQSAYNNTNNQSLLGAMTTNESNHTPETSDLSKVNCCAMDTNKNDLMFPSLAASASRKWRSNYLASRLSSSSSSSSSFTPMKKLDESHASSGSSSSTTSEDSNGELSETSLSSFYYELPNNNHDDELNTAIVFVETTPSVFGDEEEEELDEYGFLISKPDQGINDSIATMFLPESGLLSNEIFSSNATSSEPDLSQLDWYDENAKRHSVLFGVATLDFSYPDSSPALGSSNSSNNTNIDTVNLFASSHGTFEQQTPILTRTKDAFWRPAAAVFVEWEEKIVNFETPSGAIRQDQGHNGVR